MNRRTVRDYSVAAIGSVIGTFLFGAIGFGLVRLGLGWLATLFSLGLEVVLPAALFVGLCSWGGAVFGCWFGLKRVNADRVGQTLYLQAGLLVPCYAALLGIRLLREQTNLFVAWAVLVVLSALLSRRVALWGGTRNSL